MIFINRKTKKQKQIYITNLIYLQLLPWYLQAKK